jgi:hypothetical protein
MCRQTGRLEQYSDFPGIFFDLARYCSKQYSCFMTKVTWGKPVEKPLDLIPDVITRKFRLWVALVEESGIREVRKHKGFHDESLKGKRH